MHNLKSLRCYGRKPKNKGAECTIIESVKQANGKGQNGNSSIAKINTSKREKGEKSTQVKTLKQEVVGGPRVVGGRGLSFLP